MPLNFHPRQGAVLICDFTGFKVPEMVKRRPVVVISPRPRRTTQLCTIVPLSTTVPNPVEGFHHRLDPKSLPGKFAATETWAKCDMVATVSLERLDRVRIGKDANGKRLYAAEPVQADDLEAIQRAVLVALGMVLPT
jgi:mRNA interferase MazF